VCVGIEWVKCGRVGLIGDGRDYLAIYLAMWVKKVEICVIK
jgi:hypothetical protein